MNELRNILDQGFFPIRKLFCSSRKPQMYLINVIQLADPVCGGKGLGVRVLHLAVAWIELNTRLFLQQFLPCPVAEGSKERSKVQSQNKEIKSE